MQASDDDYDKEEEGPIAHAVDVAVVFQALEVARVEANVDRSDCFRSVPLGGFWIAEHLGVAMDAWKGQCIGQEANTFCQHFVLQESARFDVGLYGRDGALLMARCWLAKMQFFFDQWVEMGCKVPCPWPAGDNS